MFIIFIIWEKSILKAKDEKKSNLYFTYQMLLTEFDSDLSFFLSYSLYPDLKEKPLENLQWSIDPGADLAQYKMDVTVIDTKVSHRFATGQHAP